jgi:hypothetical protein
MGVRATPPITLLTTEGPLALTPQGWQHFSTSAFQK